MIFRTLFLVTLLATFIGCSGGTPPLAPVKGQVLLDGAPLANAKISFIPTEGGRPSGGKTDDDGYYELVFIEKTKGALIGHHKVVISTYDDENETQEKVPTKYNSKTILIADLDDQGEDALDFDLKTK